MNDKHQPERAPAAGADPVRQPGFRARLKALTQEDRPFRARLLTAVMVSVTLAFSFFFYGPVDLYITNIGDVSFSLGSVLWFIALVAVLVFAAVCGAALLLRGRLHDLFLSFAFGLLACGYVQGNLLNIPLGTLDGSEIAWESYTIHAVINLLVWLVILLLPLAFRYFSREGWTKLLRYGSFFFFAVQLVVLVFQLLTTEFLNKDSYLSKETMFKLSPDRNVVVFVLDRTDNRYIDAVKAQDPQFFDGLRGFTYYRNFTGSYSRTYPAIPYLLTAEHTEYTKPAREFTSEAFQSSRFLPTIKEKGYDVDVLMQSYGLAGSTLPLEGLADNFRVEKKKLDAPAVSKMLYTLAGYRYAPHALKPSFWMYTDDLNTIVQEGEYVIDDARFYGDLKREKLRADNERGKFVFYHLNGSHDPYRLDENGGRVVAAETTVERQTMGVMRIMYEYLNQMKELGIFKDSAVLITTDHGVTYWKRELPDSTNPILFYKPAGVGDEEPLAVSGAPVSQEDFHATVIDAVGGNKAEWGTPFNEWAEDAQRERIFRMSASSGISRDGYLRKYRIMGDANDFKNWVFADEHAIEYPFYVR